MSAMAFQQLRYNPTPMRIWETSWLDFIGLALAISCLEAAIRGVGVTRGRNWRVAPRFWPILGTRGRWLACARRGGRSDEVQSASAKLTEIACFDN